MQGMRIRTVDVAARLVVGGVLVSLALAACGSTDSAAPGPIPTGATASDTSAPTGGSAESPEAETPTGEAPDACSLLDVEKIKPLLAAANYVDPDVVTLESSAFAGETTCKVNGSGGRTLEILNVQGTTTTLETRVKAAEPIAGLADAFHDDGWYAFRKGWVLVVKESSGDPALAEGIFKMAVEAFPK